MPELTRDSLIALARAGGALAMEHYGRCTPGEKANLTLVTVADQAIEDWLRPRLLELLPGSMFVGEETGGGTAAAATAEWVWVVDPLDGTAAFVEGIDNFCVSIGLLRHGLPYAGAVFFPALGHIYSALAGQGAWYDGRRVSVLAVEPLADLAVLYVGAKAHLEYRITYPGKTRSLGSTALHYLLVARGAATGAVSTAYAWDYVGAAAVLLEAGGVIRHLDGSEINWPAWLAGRNLTPPVLGAPAFCWEKLAADIVAV